MGAEMAEPAVVSTGLGELAVGQTGTGAPTVLWHSLWVDSRSWGPLVTAFARHRRVLTIDGPGYGRSSPIRRDFTLADCAEAACEVLDRLGIAEPVDWVGNAWGGHVGIALAASRPERLRSLVTIAAPLTPIGRRQRWTQTYPLALVYRLLGPNRLISGVLSQAMLGSDISAAYPDRATQIMAAFAEADRESIRRTIRFMHRWRPLTDTLRTVAVPTLLITGDLADQHWRPADAHAAAAAMPDGRALGVSGAGHLAPLVVDVDEIVCAVTEFWESLR